MQAGYVSVKANVQIAAPGDLLRVECGLSYGQPLLEWFPDPGPDGNFGIGPTGYDYVLGPPVTVQPLSFARRMMISVESGNLMNPAVGAGGSIILSAMPRVITAAPAAPCTISVMWECVGV